MDFRKNKMESMKRMTNWPILIVFLAINSFKSKGFCDLLRSESRVKNNFHENISSQKDSFPR
jgi:hypothetical protein